jgi:hypothetical protein
MLVVFRLLLDGAKSICCLAAVLCVVVIAIAFPSDEVGS